MFNFFPLDWNLSGSLSSYKDMESMICFSSGTHLWLRGGDSLFDKTRNQEVGFLLSAVRNPPLAGCLTWSLSHQVYVKVYLTVKE